MAHDCETCPACGYCDTSEPHWDACGDDDALTGVEIDARCPERMGDGLCICGGEWIHGTCGGERCLSCDHGKTYHDVDGQCWFTVERGGHGANLVCPCDPPRSCDSIPADARWEVGCEPGRCVAGHQQLNTEEKDGGLFAALKRYGRWLDRWR